MKKISSVALLFLVSYISSNEVQAQKTSFSVYGGPNLSKIYSTTGGGGSYKSVLGFNFGFAVQIPLKDEFYIQPGLSINTKGAKYQSGEKLKTVYTEIPVNFFYKHPWNDGFIIAGAGPYFAFGSGGSVTNTNGKNIDLVFKNNISLSEDSTDNIYLKRFDFGLNASLGYEFSSRLQVFLNVQAGLINISSRVNSNPPEHRLRNIQPAFTVGYRL